MTDEAREPGLIRRVWPAAACAIIAELVSLSFVFDVSIRPFNLTYVPPVRGAEFFHQGFESIAIAIVITIIVKEMIERAYDVRQHEAMMAAANMSRQSVLKTLFRSFFDETTVAEAYESVFSSTLVRERAAISYKFTPHPRSEWLIRMQVTIEYTIMNAATTPAPFEVEVKAANYAAIFQQDEGLEPPRLVHAEIGDAKLTDEEITIINSKIGRHARPVCFSLGTHVIKSGKSLDVSISYERDKLICDAELMTMSFPTKKVTLQVENECAPEVEVCVSRIGRCGFNPPPGYETMAQWECESDGILLIHNGWNLYWNDCRLRPSAIPGQRVAHELRRENAEEAAPASSTADSTATSSESPSQPSHSAPRADNRT